MFCPCVLSQKPHKATVVGVLVGRPEPSCMYYWPLGHPWTRFTRAGASDLAPAVADRRSSMLNAQCSRSRGWRRVGKEGGKEVFWGVQAEDFPGGTWVESQGVLGSSLSAGSQPFSLGSTEQLQDAQLCSAMCHRSE